MTRNIEFHVSEFSLFTEWISVNDKELLLEKVIPMRNEFLMLVTLIDKDIKGIHTDFYELDADDFGDNDNPDEVVKYKVTFTPLGEFKFTEEWRD